MKLLLKVMYDGTDFSGFQAQKKLRTVQGELTECFSRLFKMPVMVTGCSRTDSGVHALGFCLTVHPANAEEAGETWCKIPVSKVARAANNILPRDISVAGAFTVDDSFHPRYSVVKKTYIYKLWDGAVTSPFIKGYVTEVNHRLTDEQIIKMKKAASFFEGRYDFTSFMAKGSKITDPVRFVYGTDVRRERDGTVVFSVSADGFLYNMVRIMAGTLLSVANGKTDVQDIVKIIEKKDRSFAGETLPPYGLYLESVEYPFEIYWETD